MAIIKIHQFGGEIPKTPAHLLPEGSAQYAMNCDLADGSLKALKQGADFGVPIAQHTGVAPVTALFFRDAASPLRYYSNTAHTNPGYRSPVADDMFKRVYMLQRQATGVIGSTTNAHLVAYGWDKQNTNGGEPTDTAPYTNQAIVGVPRPTIAPSLSVIDIVDRVPGVTSPQVEVKGWWESGGVRYVETTLTSSTGDTYMREWLVSAPAAQMTTSTDAEGNVTETGTPLNAVFGASVTLRDGTTTLFTLSTTTGASAPARSNAFPGGVELTISKLQATIFSTTYSLRLTWGVFETRAYVFTCVNEWNEESAPSPAAIISLNYMQKVRALCFFPVFRLSTASLEKYYQKRKRGAAGINVYRTFGGSADYLKIVHGAGSGYDRYNGNAGDGNTTSNYPQSQGDNVSSIVFDDAHTPNAAGTALVSTDWSVPPDGNDLDASGALLTVTVGQPEGLTQMPNGWFAMFRGNTLYMSEPYRPHAWPYSMTFPNAIKAMCMGAQSLVVATQDAVYLVNGSHPAAVSQTRLSVPAGGVSQKGICNVEGAVAVVTNDGVLMVRGSEASFGLSQKLFTRAAWRVNYASSTAELAALRLSYQDGALIGSYPDRAGFIVRLDEDGGFSRLDLHMSAVANYPDDDSLVYCTPGVASGRRVLRFRGSANTFMTMTWWSREYTFPRTESMGAFYIRCDGAEYVDVYLEGALYYQVVAPGTGYYRIPSSHLGRDGRGLRWSVKLSGQATIYEFVMAQTMAELKNA